MQCINSAEEQQEHQNSIEVLLIVRCFALTVAVCEQALVRV